MHSIEARFASVGHPAHSSQNGTSMLKKIRIAFAASAILGFSLIAQAQQNHDHAMHQAPPALSPASDTRQMVNFPPAMKEHTLANMRDHLQALSEILTMIAGGQFAKAAEIADARLGMGSPSAEGCKSNDAAATVSKAKAMNTDHQMAEFMPEGMRNLGLEMHKSASVFAAEAMKTGKPGGSDKKALAALSQLTQQCVACHGAYRLQ
jgi:hypothetical protein